MFKKYITGFFLASVVLIGINLLIILISELKNLGNHQYSLYLITKYIVFLIPQNFLDIFPYALLIGSMIAFGSMAYHSEIVAINSHGVGIKKTIKIILIQTLFLSLFFTLLTNAIAPELSNKAQSMKNIALNKSSVNKNIWFKTSKSIINVDKVITDNDLENIKIYNITNGALSSIITAKKAFFTNQWNLVDVNLLDVENNKITNKNSYTITAKEFIPFQILKSRFNKKRYNSIEDLYNNIIFYNDRGMYYEDHKITFWQKVFLPISCCIIIFVGLPFLFTKIRSTNQSQKIIFGILFGVTYFVITNIIINIALIFNIPALICVLISMGLFVLFGVFLFNKLVKEHIPI